MRLEDLLKIVIFELKGVVISGEIDIGASALLVHPPVHLALWN